MNDDTRLDYYDMCMAHIEQENVKLKQQLAEANKKIKHLEEVETNLNNMISFMQTGIDDAAKEIDRLKELLMTQQELYLVIERSKDKEIERLKLTIHEWRHALIDSRNLAYNIGGNDAGNIIKIIDGVIR